MKKEFMMPEVKVMALNMRENIASSDIKIVKRMEFKKGSPKFKDVYLLKDQTVQDTGVLFVEYYDGKADDFIKCWVE